MTSLFSRLTPWAGLWVAAYIGTIVAANWAITEFGLVPVGFGLVAPAGVYFAGLAFTFRDLVHETAGRVWSLIAIVVGALLSLILADPIFAVASGIAFFVSESADLLVYSRLRSTGWMPAVLASNVVGFATDSVLFLLLAFGSLEFLAGQLVGKAWMTALAIGILWLWRRGRARTFPFRDENPASTA